MASFFRMLAVNCADTFAIYVLEVMVTYLTDAWNLSLTHAAAIINIFVGGRDMLLVGMVFLVDAYLGYHHLFLISAILNCIGMSLLSLSTPPILSKEVSKTQKSMYYTALPILAIGYAGHAASYQRSLESTIDTNITYQDLWTNIYKGLKIMAAIICDYKLAMKNYKFIGGAIIFVLSHVGGFAIQFVKSWALRFGISAICVIVATFMYLTGVGSYRKGTPRGSPLTTFFRVLVASFSKKSCTLPDDANELYQENVRTMPHTNKLRCLDRAAIIVPSSSLEQQKGKRWKLCSVTEVEEAKIFLYMIPLWMTFATCGVVSSIGGTYFVEQGNQMNPYLGKLKLPIFTLLVFHKLAETLLSFICGIVRDMLHAKYRKYVAPIGMIVATLCSILCCITAAAVEKMRLDAMKSHGLLMEKPKDKNRIPMTMFWLIPQYVLLSCLNAISSYSSTRFFNDQVPESLRSYLVDITLGVTGAGIMGSAVTVYVIGKASEIGGNQNWFQDTLNKSRLDNYYWSLAALSSINLVLCTLLALQFPYRDSEQKDFDPFGEDQLVEDRRVMDIFDNN